MSMTRRNQKIYIPYYQGEKYDLFTEAWKKVSQTVFYEDRYNKLPVNNDGYYVITFARLMKILKNYPVLKKEVKKYY